MEILEALYKRRSVRHYDSRPVPAFMVMSLLEAAVQAPSAANQQAWAFAVVRGVERLAGFSERAKTHLLAHLPQRLSLHQRSDQLTDSGYNVFHGAGTLILVCEGPSAHPCEGDCFLASQNLMLAAHSLGLGTCPIGFVTPWLNLPVVKRGLGLNHEFKVVLPIVLGWPAGETRPVSRREPNVLVWSERPEENVADEASGA